MADESKESPEALYEMGKRFYLPTSGAPDPLLAVHYFELAAQKGYAPAQRVLGGCYLDGRLAPPDYEKARCWLAAAARQNDGQAAYSLALIYARGLGVPKDWGLAWRLLDMEEAREITEARLLKDKMKAELVRGQPETAAEIARLEERRRTAYDERQKRFIAPWNTPGRLLLDREEFGFWLDLTLKKTTPAEAEQGLLLLVNQYYDQMEALYQPMKKN